MSPMRNWFIGRTDRRRSNRQPTVRLQTEALEGRLNPAIFNIAAGDTAGFAAAINASNTNNQADTIELAAGSTYTFSAVADPADGGSALPSILRDTADANTLTIHGNGATLQRSTDVGTPQFRFIRTGVFPNNIAVTISNLSFLNGDAGTAKGGAILLQAGDLTMTGCTFSNDQADTGGAVYATTTSVALHSVSIASSVFTGDTATGSNNGGAGGAIYLLGSSNLDVEGSTFSGNTSAKEGGAVRVQTSSGTITIGNSLLASNTANGGNGGGAIFDQGPTTITNTTVRDNISAAGGGGIWVQSGGSLVLTGSTVSTNFANGSTASGGGVFTQGALTVVNSTIQGNRAGNGGGIAFVVGAPTGTITNSTITDNRAFFGLAKGGGIEVTGSGVLSLGNTIVAGNGFDAGINGTGPDIGGPVTSLGYNLIQDPTGATLTGNLTGNINGSPNLGLLQNNGGPTATRLPLTGSPVIDAGDPAFAPPPTTDQRGLPRVQNGRIDIGAVEVAVAVPPTVAAVTVNDGSAQRSEVRSIAVTFSGPVTFAGGNANAPAAFQLNHVQSGNNVALAAAVSTDGQGRTVVTLTFSGTETDPVSGLNGGQRSLADGRYTLTILSANVSDGNGVALAGGGPNGNFVSPPDTLGGGAGQLHLYRQFGDTNGDGVDDQQDLGQFRSTFNLGAGNPSYLAYLDADNSGVVDQVDLGQFRSRFNLNVY